MRLFTFFLTILIGGNISHLFFAASLVSESRGPPQDDDLDTVLTAPFGAQVFNPSLGLGKALLPDISQVAENNIIEGNQEDPLIISTDNDASPRARGLEIENGTNLIIVKIFRLFVRSSSSKRIMDGSRKSLWKATISYQPNQTRTGPLYSKIFSRRTLVKSGHGMFVLLICLGWTFGHGLLDGWPALTLRDATIVCTSRANFLEVFLRINKHTEEIQVTAN